MLNLRTHCNMMLGKFYLLDVVMTDITRANQLTLSRLVTGGRDGLLRIWNYNNGQCLRTLRKGSNEEVTCVIHVTVSKNK